MSKTKRASKSSSNYELGIIIMADTCAKERLIKDVLQKLGVQLKKKYSVFGNLKTVITQKFV